MGEADCRIGGVHTLASGTTGTECVDTHIAHIQLHVELLSLGQHHDTSRRGMDASLCLSGRHTLHTMHTTLILQQAVYTLAGDGESDIFISSRCALIEIGDLNFPMLLLAETGIHTEQVAGKDTGFVTTRATTYLNHGILRVGGIGRDEQKAYVILHGFTTILTSHELFFCHLTQFRVFLIFKQFLTL